MTNNEAIGILAIVVETAKGRCFVTDEAISDAYAMTISALQAQEAKAQLSAEGTTSDLISRQAAIDRINKQREHLQPGIYPQDKIGDAAYRICAEFIERLPSAQPEIEERTEKFAQNVPKEDLISRKAAIEAECEVCQIAPKKERGHNCTYYVHGCKEIECLRELPSVQPERKKGKWIDGRCSICGCDIPAYIIDWKWQKDMDANYCPVCGADMREDQHDQSK